MSVHKFSSLYLKVLARVKKHQAILKQINQKLLSSQKSNLIFSKNFLRFETF